jgi:SAM-dependent methyltransferase
MDMCECRLCGKELVVVFADFGHTPLANGYLQSEACVEQEPLYPLKVFVCDSCYLVQVPEFVSPADLFTQYSYLSSCSSTWQKHCKTFCDTACQNLSLERSSFVVELASNDGTLLHNFQALGIRVLGVEPSVNVAAIAESRGVPTHNAFFGAATATDIVSRYGNADLVVANNVLAHVPDIHDFVAGISLLLKPSGRVSVEFPHVVHLIADCQFDTIYHEHFSYLSLYCVERALAEHGLKVIRVDELSTHGGSLRVQAARIESEVAVDDSVQVVRDMEMRLGITRLETYEQFFGRVAEICEELRSVMTEAKSQGLKIAAYGAAAKGAMLLSFCKIGPELVSFVSDRNTEKQGKLLPGTRIPVFGPEHIMSERPDIILILPWNLKAEIVSQLSFAREWGARFIVPIPAVAEV